MAKRKTPSAEVLHTAALFLHYSFRDIQNRYAWLSNPEQRLCSEDEFNALTEFVSDTLRVDGPMWPAPDVCKHCGAKRNSRGRMPHKVTCTRRCGGKLTAV
jgi:hypothetical protein